MTTPLIIAGAGYVGGALAEKLSATRSVITIRRSPHQLRGCTSIAIDLSTPLATASQDLLPACDSVDIVYAVAAKERSEAIYQSAYVNGMKNLLAALADRNTSVGRLIFVSSTAVYGHRQGELVDESSPTEPLTFPGKILLAAERNALTSFANHKTVLRLSGIYGPGRDRLVRQARDQSASFADPDFYTNRIHLDDCVGMIKFLLTAESPPATVIGSDREPTKKNTVLRWLSEQTGASVPTTSVEHARGAGKRLDSSMLASLGYQWKHPTYKSGYDTIITSQPTS